MNESEHKAGWPFQFDTLKPPTAFSIPVSVVAIIIFIACIIIAILALTWLLADLISGDQRRASDAAKTALPLLAGAIGLPLIIWRLLILDRQTRISDEKTQIDRETHYTSIFSRSIDQLGQTRELKSTRATISGSEAITRTVPNIEVRLGGIHSLARLAEESRRDRAKIESTLLSYVRENSWFDRDGERSIRPAYSHSRTIGWSGRYRRGPITKSATEEYKSWVEDVERTFKTQTDWSDSLPESRVDVNEATDAVCGIDAVAQNDSRLAVQLTTSAPRRGRVLNATDAPGAALCTALISISNSSRLLGGRRIPPPITTQSPGLIAS